MTTLVPCAFCGFRHHLTISCHLARYIRSGPQRRLKATLYKEQNGKCLYCKETFPYECELTFEHLTPKSRGGSNKRENLGLSCQKCNSLKANMTHEEYLESLVK